MKNYLPAAFIALVVALPVLATIAGTASHWEGNKLVMSDKLSMTSNSATCNLDGGSPSQCDVTVTASAKCTCGPVGATAVIAAGGCAVSISSTTVTATSANALTNAVNVLCDR